MHPKCSWDSRSPGLVLAKSLFRSWPRLPRFKTSMVKRKRPKSSANPRFFRQKMAKVYHNSPASRASPSTGRPLDLKEPRPEWTSWGQRHLWEFLWPPSDPWLWSTGLVLKTLQRKYQVATLPAKKFDKVANLLFGCEMLWAPACIYIDNP